MDLLAYLFQPLRWTQSLLFGSLVLSLQFHWILSEIFSSGRGMVAEAKESAKSSPKICSVKKIVFKHHKQAYLLI